MYKPHCRIFFYLPFLPFLFRKEKRADRKTDGDLLFSATVSITRVAASLIPVHIEISFYFRFSLPLCYANKSGVKSGPDLLGATSTDIRCRELTRIGIRGRHSVCRIELMFCRGSISRPYSLPFTIRVDYPFHHILLTNLAQPKGVECGEVTKSTDCARPPWICRETNKETHSVGVSNGPMSSFFFLAFNHFDASAETAERMIFIPPTVWLPDTPYSVFASNVEFHMESVYALGPG